MAPNSSASQPIAMSDIAPPIYTPVLNFNNEPKLFQLLQHLTRLADTSSVWEPSGDYWASPGHLGITWPKMQSAPLPVTA